MSQLAVSCRKCGQYHENDIPDFSHFTPIPNTAQEGVLKALSPQHPARHIGFNAGPNTGKTFLAAAFANQQMFFHGSKPFPSAKSPWCGGCCKGFRVVVVGLTFPILKDSLYETIFELMPAPIRDSYKKFGVSKSWSNTDHHIELPNGSEAVFFSSEQGEGITAVKGHLGLFDEPGKVHDGGLAKYYLNQRIRLRTKFTRPKILYTSTQSAAWYYRMWKEASDNNDPSYIEFTMDSNENIFADEEYRAEMTRSKDGSKRAQREISGAWIPIEGRVYPTLNPDIHIIGGKECKLAGIPDNFEIMVGGNDFGLSSKSTAVVVGAFEYAGRTRYIALDAYGEKQISTARLSRVDIMFMQKYPYLLTWVCDPHGEKNEWGITLPFGTEQRLVSKEIAELIMAGVPCSLGSTNLRMRVGITNDLLEPDINGIPSLFFAPRGDVVECLFKEMFEREFKQSQTNQEFDDIEYDMKLREEDHYTDALDMALQKIYSRPSYNVDEEPISTKEVVFSA